MAQKSKHLFKRKGSEQWWYRYTDPKTGEQVRRSSGSVERKVAQEKYDLDKAQAWAEANPNLAVQNKVWLEASIRWIEERSEKKRSILTDARRLNVLGEVMNNVKISDVTNDYVKDVIVKVLLKKRGISLTTVNRYITLIGSILNAAYKEWKWLNSPVFLHKPGQTVERSRKAWVTPTQFKMMCKAMPEYYTDMMLLAVATGMRHSNIANLKWSQVDMVRKSICISKEEFKGKREHYVPMNDTAISVVRKYIGKHDKMVFTVNGKHYKRTHLTTWHKVNDSLGINAQLLEAGLLDKDEKFVFHGLRHTFATWLRRTGVPLEMVENIGGWSSGKGRIATIYTHLDDVGHLLPYAKRIDEILDGKNDEKFSTVLAHNHWTKLAQAV